MSDRRWGLFARDTVFDEGPYAPGAISSGRRDRVKTRRAGRRRVRLRLVAREGRASPSAANFDFFFSDRRVVGIAMFAARIATFGD